MVELRGDTGVQMSLTNYRIQRQSFVRRAGGDEGGQGSDGRTMLRCEKGRRGRILEEEHTRQRMVEKIIR